MTLHLAVFWFVRHACSSPLVDSETIIGEGDMPPHLIEEPAPSSRPIKVVADPVRISAESAMLFSEIAGTISTILSEWGSDAIRSRQLASLGAWAPDCHHLRVTVSPRHMESDSSRPSSSPPQIPDGGLHMPNHELCLTGRPNAANRQSLVVRVSAAGALETYYYEGSSSAPLIQPFTVMRVHVLDGPIALLEALGHDLNCELPTGLDEALCASIPSLLRRAETLRNQERI